MVLTGKRRRRDGLVAAVVSFALAAGVGPASASTPTGVMIAAGNGFTCAITSSGAPTCWGDNSSGQTSIPAGTGTVTQIAAGLYNACAIRSDGTPVCWGKGGVGPNDVAAGTGAVTHITVGSTHACAIRSDGTPVCWGNDQDGQTDIPAGIGTVTDITAGGGYTCAIKSDGTPVCWGFAASGATSIPIGTGTVSQIDAGEAHTCAIKSDGTPACWGYNGFGQATIPAGIGTITAINAGQYNTCAITSDGTPACWGNSGAGVTRIPAGTDAVTQISVGSNHACAIKSGGAPTCWGSEFAGELGAAPAFALPAWSLVLGARATSLRDDLTAIPSAQTTVTSGAVPTGMSLDPSTATLSGTPKSEGTYVGQITASNLFGNATQAFSILVDLTAPTTTDDVPTSAVDHPVTVTLTATDTGGAGLDKTYYAVGTDPTATTASSVYDADHKPTLNYGERISYFSVDKAGNAETAHTSVSLQALTSLAASPATITFPGLLQVRLSPSATLTHATTGAAISGQQIAFTTSTDAAICSAVTDTHGTARCTGVVSSLNVVLGLGYRARYAGTSAYAPAVASGPLVTLG